MSGADIRDAREAFLNLLADAWNFDEEPDGDETGDHTRIIVNAKWRQWDELADALGIPARRYDESTFQRLERAVGAE